MAETNVILKYKRKEDRWVCPICDTENAMTTDCCSVCGESFKQGFTVLKKWQQSDDAVVEQPRKSQRELAKDAPVSQPTSRVYTYDTPVDAPLEAPRTEPVKVRKKRSKAWLVWLFIIAIAAAVFFIYNYLTTADAIYIYTMSESKYDYAEEAYVMRVGDTMDFNVSIDPTSASDKSVTWYSSDTDVATVSTMGLVTAKGEGECTIYARCDEVHDIINVIVKERIDFEATVTKVGLYEPFYEVTEDGRKLSLYSYPTGGYEMDMEYFSDYVYWLNDELGLPDSLWEQIIYHAEYDTEYSETHNGIVISWCNLSDGGIEIHYTEE